MSTSPPSRKIIVQNRKARYNFFITENIEAGIVLFGSEIKALRQGKASIEEAFVDIQQGELYLVNSFINEYAQARHFTHETTRPRKLLLNHREIHKILGAIQRKGMTVVPLSFYFSPRGRVKVDLGIAEGKNKVDKREHEKQRDWDRQKGRLLREKG